MKEKKLHYAWWIMMGCCAVMFAGMGIVNNCAGIFFKPVCEVLGFSRGQFAAYTSVQAVVIILTLPFAGRLLPKVNLRVFLSTLAILMCAAFMAMSQFHSIYAWYAAGLFLGLGTGAVALLAPAILIGNWFQDRVGLAMGITMSCSGFGGAIFNPVGSMLIEHYGWRTAYLALGGMALIIMLPFTLFALRFKPSDMGLKPYVTSATAAVSTQGAAAAAAPGELAGISAKIAFRSSAFYFLLVFIFGVSIFIAMLQHIPGYASSLEYPPTFGASLLSLSMMGMIIGKIGFGVLNDRIGVYRTAMTGIAMAVLGILCLILGKMGALVFSAGAVLTGIGMAMPTVQNPMIVRDLFGRKEYSAIFSVATMVFSITTAIGVIGIGIAYDKTHSFLLALILIMISLGIAFVGVLISRKRGTKLKVELAPK
jgi:MFS family permease